ncbi:nitrate- and nitrite sensing domain-containing protein [Streptomyces sp. GC420]|uniref:sensor histidine kinase n=1 Tax=Streptomyces sp. GC420 TaxID=2697568 RepID=UPI0014152A28|nr:nitrate- and nitrite sensing domain-containing protein [Streptomyces sp. GC420]NBM19678.1 HAMP domain-containing protein [Streptomyces sp. GC420]
MRFRGKSIRRKIVALLLVPLVSLTALWGFATVITGREAAHLLDLSQVGTKLAAPIEDAIQALQRERRGTLMYLADPRASDTLAELRRQRSATDAEVAAIRSKATAEVREAMGEQSRRRLDAVLEGLDGLDSLRRTVEQNNLTRGQAMAFYVRLVDPCYTFLGGLDALHDAETDRQRSALFNISQARELLSREDAILASGLAARSFGKKDVRQLTELVAGRKMYYDTNLPALPSEDRTAFLAYWEGPEAEPLLKAEERVIAAGASAAPRAIGAQDWNEAAAAVLDDLDRLDEQAAERFQSRIEPVASGIIARAVAAGALGFVALLVSIVVSARIGRGLARDLSRLRHDAHEVSGIRLPSVMRRLASGEQVDVDTEAPRLEYAKDEIGQVAKALNTLQRAAIEAAVKQAEMRRGISEVFVNLARRSQVLLHRQLTLLDTMERRTEDTEELADLFRLDHLTTRMRRHAEGLVILSGAAPSRQWRKPVQLMDVVRAAVAEVEDYERIEVRRLPRMSVNGPAVSDLTHLIAELLENATVFSPPHTAVQVVGERVANGFTLEIHDRGLGMTPETLLDANLRLAETPEFELSDTDRLGLFVVSRLAQRQNVRVSLQPSPYGGTTAVVFIPAALLTDAPDTNGSGLSLDRGARAGRGEGTGGRGGTAARLAALAQVPVALPDLPAGVLGGPVELEAPFGAIDLDEPDRRGGLIRDVVRERESETHRKADDDRRPGGPEAAGPTGRSGAPGSTGPARRPGPPGRQHPSPADPAGPTGTADHGASPGDDTPAPLPRRRSSTPASPVPRLVVADRNRAAGKAGTQEPEQREPMESNKDEPPSGGLPRRKRQANLAPQLRKGPARLDLRNPSGEPEPDRDADEVRSRMASLQRGWERGREQNDRTEQETGTAVRTGGRADSRKESRADPRADSGTEDRAEDRAEREPAPGDTAQRTTSEGDGR